MKTIANTFLKGLLFTLPAFITFGLIYWVFSTAEQLLRIPLELVLPEGWYMTGMGVASTLLIIFIIGLLAQAYLLNRVFAWLESLVERIPFVKTLYTSAKDFLSFLTGNNGQEMQRVVRITMDNGIQVIGFVTNEDVTLGDQESLVAVYVPMSYMIGGFLLYMPRHRCEPLDISVQHAMQQVLTAHITYHHKNKN
ncbi:MAG: DUF502 domain-containing protein [Cellvibrionaceae bacterium]